MLEVAYLLIRKYPDCHTQIMVVGMGRSVVQVVFTYWGFGLPDSTAGVRHAATTPAPTAAIPIAPISSIAFKPSIAKSKGAYHSPAKILSSVMRFSRSIDGPTEIFTIKPFIIRLTPNNALPSLEDA